MMNFYAYDTSIGRIGVGEENGYITNIYLTPKTFPRDVNVFESQEIKEASEQLRKYFSGESSTFRLPLNPKGTKFMQKVWDCLCSIPYGDTASYKDIALKINSPRAYRAVGNANNKNPIPIVIPCHRVIGNDGKLTGYAGGLDMKEKLLDIEKNNKK